MELKDSHLQQALDRKFERAQQLAKVCRLYYIEELSQKEIKGQIGVKDDSAVSRLLKEAREKGVVAFDIDATFGVAGQEEPVLSRKLRDAFCLDGAIVVDIELRSGGRSDDQDSLVQDDNLHTLLGNHTGLQIKDRIDPADHIAVGGGRAVCQAVRFIRRQAPSRKGIRITPLCGRLWTHYWQTGGPNLERPLDADDAAFVLGLGFAIEPDTRFSQVMSPLFASDSTNATTRMEEHCPFLPNGTWRSGEPRLALVGIGEVRGGHRLAGVCREKRPVWDDIYLSDAADGLKEALSYVEEKGLPCFGDITNRLFPSLPLPGALQGKPLEDLNLAYGELQDKLRHLNGRMVVTRWDHLRSISKIVATAGGAFKVEAIWTVLIVNYLLFKYEQETFKKKRIVTELCTDGRSAEALLKALDDYERSDEAIKAWYKSIYREVFKD